MLQPVGAHDGFEDGEKTVRGDVELSLLARIDAMHVEPTEPVLDHAALSRRNDLEPYIQFPEEENELAKEGGLGHNKLTTIR
jgi:hypothetical protein